MVVDHGILLSLHSPESLNTLIPHALEEFLLPTVDTSKEPPNTAIRYVQTLPGSAFWLSYRILTPPSPELDTKLYVFKLFFGRAHFTTWSIDGAVTTSQGRWRGRCMFGLFEEPSVVDHTSGGRKVFQKRALSFAAPPPKSRRSKERVEDRSSNSSDAADTGRKKLKKKKTDEFVHPFTPPKSWGKRAARNNDDERFIEVKVFRARGKTRIPRDVVGFDPQAYDLKGVQGLDLKNAGCAARPNPRRYYEFDLIDPKDEPYTAFRFYYRTMEELKTLGMELDGEYTPSPKAPSVDSQATITPEKACTIKTPAVNLKQRFERAVSSTPAAIAPDQRMDDIGSLLPISRRNTPEEQADTAPTKIKRLTIPPLIKLMPTFGSWKDSPQRQAPLEHDEARFHPTSTLTGKLSAEDLRTKRSSGPWRAFHEEREAEHEGY